MSFKFKTAQEWAQLIPHTEDSSVDVVELSHSRLELVVRRANGGSIYNLSITQTGPTLGLYSELRVDSLSFNSTLLQRIVETLRRLGTENFGTCCNFLLTTWRDRPQVAAPDITGLFPIHRSGSGTLYSLVESTLPPPPAKRKDASLSTAHVAALDALGKSVRTAMELELSVAQIVQRIEQELMK